jgi:phenylacetate-CoA ligase
MPIEDRLYGLLKYYTPAPQWVKSAVGHAYSSLPASWRYGTAYYEFREELALNDSVSIRRRWRDKLQTTLEWALHTVPAYQRYRGMLADLDEPLQLLERLPLLDKNAIKANPASFLSDASSGKARLVTHTGGSTSQPMKIYLERFVSRSKDFAYNGAFDGIAGIGAGDIILALRGRSVGTATKATSELWMFDPIKRYFHLSSDHLEPAFMPRYVEALRRWKPTFVHAFPSAIYPLARWLADHPAPEVTQRIRAVQLFSENVYDYQVDLLEKVFGCPVLLDYGLSERTAKAVSRPRDKRYFFWPLYGHVELVDLAGQPVREPGRTGEIVTTAFDNRAMPLVRYRTGDLATLSKKPNHVFSGFVAVDRIEGRLQEFIVCKDARLVSITTIGVAHLDALSFAQYMQFEQREPGHLILKVVSEANIDRRVAAR